MASVDKQAAGLNDVQLSLLRMFNRKMSYEESVEIRDLLVQHYSDKLGNEVDRVVSETRSPIRIMISCATSEFNGQPRLKLVIDTNVLITTINRRNPAFVIYQAFEQKAFNWIVSTEILTDSGLAGRSF